MRGSLPSAESANTPIWRLIGEAAGMAMDQSPKVVDATHRDWHNLLGSTLSDSRANSVVVVAVDRPAAMAFLGLLAHGRWRRRDVPRLGEVLAFLTARGIRIDARYGLWPASQHPRLAFPHSGRRAFAWVQRSGVLGGGGSRIGARALARSSLFTPLALVLTPGVALVARVPERILSPDPF